ncbi:hypothetical protein [Myxosarcina sp. GI1]|uniref:hypothetical protein n=1 Tax=Myxosarcina sp. GI1 TaxID=1541065 RepID=UPI00055F6D8A|nr:hypothetical protein [Myxosarcina sp. GI1]
MSQHKSSQSFPAPCIVDTGIVINRDDIKRLLNDLGCVRYVHTIDNHLHSKGEGKVREVFNDPDRATLIANGNLYINIQSFNYLQLGQSSEAEVCFDLIQENLQLRLIPLSPSSKQNDRDLDAAVIEAMVAEVLSARLDVQLDDEDF